MTRWRGRCTEQVAVDESGKAVKSSHFVLFQDKLLGALLLYVGHTILIHELAVIELLGKSIAAGRVHHLLLDLGGRWIPAKYPIMTLCSFHVQRKLILQKLLVYTHLPRVKDHFSLVLSILIVRVVVDAVAIFVVIFRIFQASQKIAIACICNSKFNLRKLFREKYRK